MIDDILDGVVACPDVFGDYRRVRFQKRHVEAPVRFRVPMEVEDRLPMRHGDGEGDRIRQ